MLKIKKSNDYKEHNCRLGLGDKKDAEFNKGKPVEVTENEYKELSGYDWCEKYKEKIK